MVEIQYPSGLVIFFGVGIFVIASYILPTINYTGSTSLNILKILGVVIVFAGIAIMVSRN